LQALSSRSYPAGARSSGHDLSARLSPPDIANVVAITALQAQALREKFLEPQMHQINTDKERNPVFLWLSAILKQSTSTFFLPPFLQVLLCASGVCICGCFLPASARKRPAQDVAVNLAGAALLVCAANDGMIVATADDHTEPGSRQPVVVTLSAFAQECLLGAVEWIHPARAISPFRLDATRSASPLSALNTLPAEVRDAASDIESIVVALLEPLREVAGPSTHKINLGGIPLLLLVLGRLRARLRPESWAIDYTSPGMRSPRDYWRTRVPAPEL